MICNQPAVWFDFVLRLNHPEVACVLSTIVFELDAKLLEIYIIS